MSKKISLTDFQLPFCNRRNDLMAYPISNIWKEELMEEHQ